MSVIKLAITALAHDGRGIGFLPQPGQARGLAVFVPGALPGQTVSCNIVRTAKNFGEAQLLEVLHSDFAPQTPHCPDLASCGACPLQPLPYREQLRLKETQVQNALIHVGKFAPQKIQRAWTGIFASQQTTQHRNKLTLAFGKTEAGEPALGMRGRASHAVAPVRGCALADASAMSIAAAAFALARDSGLPFYDGDGFWRFLTLRRASAPEGGDMAWRAILLTSPADKVAALAARQLGARLLASQPHLAAFIHEERRERDFLCARGRRRACLGSPHMALPLGGRMFGLDAASFFQVNNGAAEILAQTVQNMDAEAGGPLLDICCGVGAPGQLLHARHERCLGIERDSAAIGWARKNASGLSGFGYQRAVCGDFLAEMAIKGKKGFFKTALLDPPRAGLGAKAIVSLAHMAPERIIHISCDAATLARDAALLARSYELERIVGIDMFPHTPHVECCALWRRK